MLFILKKFIAQFLMPLPFICTCFAVGWILHRLTRFKKTGTMLKVVSFVLFVFLGCGGGHRWLYQIERACPPFDPTPEVCGRLDGTPIVVLGQGVRKHSDLPVRCRERPLFTMRFLEGVRVARLLPKSRLYVSMGGTAPEADKQAYLASLLETVAFPTNRVTVLNAALDTGDEAALARKAIEASGVAVTNEPPVIIATSAAHMRRALRIFEKRGFKPIPAPAEYLTFLPSVWTDREWYLIPFPSQENLDESHRAIYEWFGGVFERLKP